MRLTLALAAVLLCAATAVASAGAATRECRVGYFAPSLDGAEPAVGDLRARGLPRRTDGYAPPCLVAESVAAAVQRGAAEGDPPATVRVFGARWNGGTWRCTYTGTAATCRKAGKPRRRVTFRLGA